MKKKLIALVLLFALFFSTLPQGAEAKTKQKKLDYSKMPYLDTLIYNKDFEKNGVYSASRKYLKLIEEAAKTGKITKKYKDAEGYFDDDMDLERTYTNDYGPNFYGTLSDKGLAFFLNRLKLDETPIYLETDFNKLPYEFDDTVEVNKSLKYISLKILQDRNPETDEYDCNMGHKIGYSIASRMKFINDNAILPKNFLKGLRKRLSINRIYKLYVSN